MSTSPHGTDESPGGSRRQSTLLQTSVHTNAAHPGEHALTRLMRRLEAATSRLEDIASSSFDGTATPRSNKGGPAAAAGSTAAAVNGVTSPMGGAIVASTSQDATPTPSKVEEPKEELPQAIEDFDALINGDLKAFHSLSKTGSIDKILLEQVGGIADLT